MATTRFISMHINKGKTIAATLTDRISYSENPQKTKDGELISAYKCDVRTADIEFYLAKRQYATITGRDLGKHDVLAYQIRQSFKPGEITAKKANQIGYELAMAFTKGNHQFIVATHIDKRHIHNHIVFNSTTLDCTRKFKDFLGTGRAVRQISDRLCIENGLSVVENPKPSRGHYGTWLGDNKPISWQEKLRRTIDAVLDKKPANILEFIQEMNAAGYEVKKGKYLSFRAKAGQKKFTRLRSLGDDYTDNAILERIEGKRVVVSKTNTNTANTDKSVVFNKSPKLNLLIDIQNSIKAKESPGYKHWTKIFNLKESARTLMFLQDNNLTEYKMLEEKAVEATENFNNLSDKLKATETRMREISTLQKHISNYAKTRNIYVEYRQAGYNKKFYKEHESEILLHKETKQAFDHLGLKKIPTIKSLQTEYAVLLAEKKKLYQSYRQAREAMQEILIAKNNTDRLLNYSQSEQQKKIHTTER